MTAFLREEILKRINGELNGDKNSELKNFRRFLWVGCALLALITATAYREKGQYAPVWAELGNSSEDDASAEPFGYFMGEWNLWEFIGDSVASLIQ